MGNAIYYLNHRYLGFLFHHMYTHSQKIVKASFDLISCNLPLFDISSNLVQQLHLPRSRGRQLKEIFIQRHILNV